MGRLLRAAAALITVALGVVLGYAVGVAVLLVAAEQGLYSVKKDPQAEPLLLDPWMGAIMALCVLSTTALLLWWFVRVCRDERGGPE